MADEIEQMNRILSAPTERTGDNVYEGAGAIDPREVGVDALNAGALTDEEFMMAEEFMDSLPPEDKPGFMELFMTKPREALNAVMDTLRQVFDREEEATIGQPSDERDEIRRRISMDMGQPAVARSGRDVNSPEFDALLDRGAVERRRFQQQEMDRRLGALPRGLSTPEQQRRALENYERDLQMTNGELQNM